MKTVRQWQTSLVVAVVFVSIWTGQARADFALSTPVNLGPQINSYDMEYDPTVSADGLEIYFQSSRAGSRDSDLYVARRLSTDDRGGPR